MNYRNETNQQNLEKNEQQYTYREVFVKTIHSSTVLAIAIFLSIALFFQIINGLITLINPDAIVKALEQYSLFETLVKGDGVKYLKTFSIIELILNFISSLALFVGVWALCASKKKTGKNELTGLYLIRFYFIIRIVFQVLSTIAYIYLGTLLSKLDSTEFVSIVLIFTGIVELIFYGLYYGKFISIMNSGLDSLFMGKNKVELSNYVYVFNIIFAILGVLDSMTSASLFGIINRICLFVVYILLNVLFKEYKKSLRFVSYQRTLEEANLLDNSFMQKYEEIEKSTKDQSKD